MSRILLISVRPDLTDKIFAGEKTVELRRVKPKVVQDDRVFVYASSPAKTLVGWFSVSAVVPDGPHRLWSRVGARSGITRSQFFDYLKGVSVGYAIMVKEIHPFPRPIPLADLRKRLAGFRPPQCYRYLCPDEMDIVLTRATSPARVRRNEARLLGHC